MIIPSIQPNSPSPFSSFATSIPIAIIDDSGYSGDIDPFIASKKLIRESDLSTLNSKAYRILGISSIEEAENYSPPVTMLIGRKLSRRKRPKKIQGGSVEAIIETVEVSDIRSSRFLPSLPTFTSLSSTMPDFSTFSKRHSNFFNRYSTSNLPIPPIPSSSSAKLTPQRSRSMSSTGSSITSGKKRSQRARALVKLEQRSSKPFNNLEGGREERYSNESLIMRFPIAGMSSLSISSTIDKGDAQEEKRRKSSSVKGDESFFSSFDDSD